MADTPTAILVVSASVGGPQSASTIEALVGGALDALPKPAHWTADKEAQFRRSVRNLAKVPVIRHLRGRARSIAARAGRTAPATTPPVVALAASTGGPAALAQVLAGLAGLAAPVLVVQHIHPDFVAGLVTWMERASALPVEAARHGQLLVAGHVYIGPGNVHLKLDASGRVALDPAPPAVHRPSADELFGSVAEHAGAARRRRGDDRHGQRRRRLVSWPCGAAAAGPSPRTRHPARSTACPRPPTGRCRDRRGGLWRHRRRRRPGRRASCSCDALEGVERIVDRAADLLHGELGLRPDPTMLSRLRRCLRDEARRANNHPTPISRR